MKLKGITDESISKVLVKYNPWWHDPTRIRAMVKPYRRLVVERALLMITHPETRHYAILSGFRYVGKTMCLYQMIDMLLEEKVPAGNILYVTFENPILKYAEIDEIDRIYRELNPGATGSRYFLFDDLLFRGHWDAWMTALFDLDQDVRLVATTSASPIGYRQRDGTTIHDQCQSGGKIWTILDVRPLSLYEFSRLNGNRLPEEYLDGNGIVRLPKDEDGQNVVPYHHLSRLQNMLIRYLKRGGLPQFAMLDKEDYEEKRFGPDLMSHLIRSDILSFFNIRHPQLCEELMLYLASKPSPIFFAQQAAKDLGNISVTTLEQYISILASANLIICSYPVDIDQKGACKGHPKIYIADPAIRNALIMHEPENDLVENDKELNLAVEVALFCQLSTHYEPRRIKPEYHIEPIYDYEGKYRESSDQPVNESTAIKPAKIGYFRKLHEPGKTIDLVVALPEGYFIFNVMFYKRLPFRWKDSITSMTKRPGAKFLGASIITRKTSDNQSVGNGTIEYYRKEPALPILYLIGQEEYEWRKEELMEERLEHDTLTGFDDAE